MTEKHVQPGPDWEDRVEALAGETVLWLGPPGVGKTTAVRWFLERLGARGLGGGVALISADPGQPACGVPTCLGLAMKPPWRTADALWFVGETSPGGHLLPLVVGAAQLAAWARRAGARTLFLDACGLVDGPVARVLHVHTAAAAGVSRVAGLGPAERVRPVLAACASRGCAVMELHPSPAARERTPEERRRYRELLYANHFQSAEEVELGVPLLGPDWAPLAADALVPGSLVALLRSGGACLALGLFLAAAGGKVRLLTPWRHLAGVRCVQASRLVLDPRSGFAEVGRLPLRGRR